MEESEKMNSQGKYDFIDFVNYMSQIEPYINDPFQLPETVIEYLNQNTQDKEILMEYFGPDIWLIRAILVKKGEHKKLLDKAEKIFPEDWMKEAYKEIFTQVENSLRLIERYKL